MLLSFFGTYDIMESLNKKVVGGFSQSYMICEVTEDEEEK